MEMVVGVVGVDDFVGVVDVVRLVVGTTATIDVVEGVRILVLGVVGALYCVFATTVAVFEAGKSPLTQVDDITPHVLVCHALHTEK